MVQRVLQLGATAQLPALAQVAGLAEQRRVILTCEKATVLLDIISKRVRCNSVRNIVLKVAMLALMLL